MIFVEEINDLAQLAPCRLLWKRLLGETPGGSFFHSLDWLEVYWRHYGMDQRLRVLLVSSDRQPLGILPLTVQRETTRVGRLRVLTYPLHDWGTFYGPIGPNPTATLLAGLRHVAQTPRDWDLLELRWVDLLGHDRGRSETAMKLAGLPASGQFWEQSPLVELPHGWEEYWRSRDKKFRHNVERCGRRLAEQGEVSLLRYRPGGTLHGDDDPRWDLYDACTTLAQRSWQGSSTDGTTLSHDGIRNFLRDAHLAAVRAGALDLSLLMLTGRPIAFVYGYRQGDRVYELRKGFDPAFAALRPGLVLQQLRLQDGCQRGDRCYDMGVGSLDVKRHWQTSLAANFRLTHFPALIARAQVLRLKRWWKKKSLPMNDRLHEAICQ
jgi:CelD/BcsL family acetyltransferase involved in cellulose biosynthesis